MRSSGLVLFVCAGLLLSGGALLVGSSSWNLLRISYYFWTTDLTVELASTVLFVSGALLCLPACWLSALVPYHHNSTTLMATLMCIASAAMMVLCVGLSSLASLSRAVRDSAMLNASMLQAMRLDAVDSAVKSSFAAMQLELKCCGVQSYSDWYAHRRTLPPSCCGRIWNGKQGEQCEAPQYARGCLLPARAELRSYIHTLSALASLIILVMAVTLFTASYMLVTGVVERASEAKQHGAQLLRIACLPHPHQPPPPPPPPLHSLTSPAVLSAPQY